MSHPFEHRRERRGADVPGRLTQRRQRHRQEPRVLEIVDAGQTHVARVGPEAIAGANMEPGDRIQVDYVVGVAVKVTRMV